MADIQNIVKKIITDVTVADKPIDGKWKLTNIGTRSCLVADGATHDKFHSYVFIDGQELRHGCNAPSCRGKSVTIHTFVGDVPATPETKKKPKKVNGDNVGLGGIGKADTVNIASIDEDFLHVKNETTTIEQETQLTKSTAPNHRDKVTMANPHITLDEELSLNVTPEDIYYRQISTGDGNPIPPLFMTDTELMTLINCNEGVKLLFKRTRDDHMVKLFMANRSRKFQIELYKIYHEDNPAQGTAAWKAQRQEMSSDGTHAHIPNYLNPYKRRPIPTVGGSEIEKLISGTVSSVSELTNSKLGKSGFNGNVATQWGNIFEEVAFDHVEKIFRCKIQQIGSIPGIRDAEGDMITSYSDDGLAAMNMAVVDGKVVPGTEERIVLFEVKDPFSRVPDGTVPKQYAAQPQLGAVTIPIVERICFVDAMFRKCSMKDIEDRYSFDRDFHTMGNNRVAASTVTAKTVGFILFHTNEKSQSWWKNAPNDVRQIELLNLGRAAIEETLDSNVQIADYVQIADNVQLTDALKIPIDRHFEALRTICLASTSKKLAEWLRNLKLSFDTEGFIVDEYHRWCNINREVPMPLSELHQLAEVHLDRPLWKDLGSEENVNELKTLMRKSVECRYNYNGIECKRSGIIDVPLPSRHTDDEVKKRENKEIMYKVLGDLKADALRVIRECRAEGKTVAGLMPWKQFKLELMHVPIDPNYREKIIGPIEKYGAFMKSLLMQTRHLTNDAREKKREEMLAEAFPSSSNGTKWDISKLTWVNVPKKGGKKESAAAVNVFDILKEDTIDTSTVSTPDNISTVDTPSSCLSNDFEDQD